MSASPVALPEIQWKWRRIFSFVVIFLSAGLIRQVIERLSDVAALKQIALSQNATICVVVFVYLCGATVTDLARMVTAIVTAVRGVPQPEKPQ